MLTIQEILFVQEYLVDLNDRKAQERAGYSTYNKNLLSKPEIKREIERQSEEKLKALSISSDYVVSNIKTLVEESMKPVPKSQINKDGEEFFYHDPEGHIIYERNTSAALKGLELLGKYKSIFTDKQETTLSVNNLETYLSKVEDKEEW